MACNSRRAWPAAKQRIWPCIALLETTTQKAALPSDPGARRRFKTVSGSVFEVPAQFETVYNFLGASMSDSSHDVQESQPPAGPKVATRLESADEIRRVIRARRAHTAKEPATEGDTVSFRPLRRPPMALLCTLDDGREEGQWLRVRGDRVVIGRGEGDIVIPHDSMLSS